MACVSSISGGENGVRFTYPSGLRKLRFADKRRSKGKRSGLRVIYFWWEAGEQFWLFTLYDKDEVDDLTATECAALRKMIKAELKARRS